MALGYVGIEKIVLLGAEGVNVGEKIANKGGIFSALALIDEVQALGTLEKGQIIAEAKDLSKEERTALSTTFKGKLSLENKSLEAKIESGVDIVDEAIDIGLEAFDAYKHVQKLVEKVKALVA